MPLVVSLQDIVAAMDLPNQEWESFLDRDSGEVVTLAEGIARRHGCARVRSDVDSGATVRYNSLLPWRMPLLRIGASPSGRSATS